MTQIYISFTLITNATRSWNHVMQANYTRTIRKKNSEKIHQCKQLNSDQNAETVFNTKQVTRAVKHAVSDSGATGNFLIEGSPVKIRKLQSTPSASRYPIEGASNQPTCEIFTYHCSLKI